MSNELSVAEEAEPDSRLEAESIHDGPDLHRSTGPLAPKPPPAQSRNIPSNVPTSLESIMSAASDDKATHEVLGVLVEAHVKEAESILGRTYLEKPEVRIVANALQLARHGIGAQYMDQPNPWISEWVLTFLRALPSVGGRSRSGFIEAWQNAQERLRREQEAREKRLQQVGA